MLFDSPSFLFFSRPHLLRNLTSKPLVMADSICHRLLREGGGGDGGCGGGD